jgi:methyl acetate hydrolase
VRHHFGGIGGFGTLPDYLTILRHLLQIEAGHDVPSAILKQETVKDLFVPRLSATAALGLNAITQITDPQSTDLNWSVAAAVNVKDWEGRRKAGSLTCELSSCNIHGSIIQTMADCGHTTGSGWAGTWYFVDPKTGIAMVFGSQVVPPMDSVTREILDKAEAIVYANLVS